MQRQSIRRKPQPVSRRHLRHGPRYHLSCLSALPPEAYVDVSIESSFQNLSQQKIFRQTKALIVRLTPHDHLAAENGQARYCAEKVSAKSTTTRYPGWLKQDTSCRSRGYEFCSGRTLLAAVFSAVRDAGNIVRSPPSRPQASLIVFLYSPKKQSLQTHPTCS